MHSRLVQQQEVRDALGVPSSFGEYQQCNNKYLFRMRVDDLTSFRGDIVTLLDNDIRVVSYNGMEDVCEAAGDARLLQWPGMRVCISYFVCAYLLSHSAADLQPCGRGVDVQYNAMEWQGMRRVARSCSLMILMVISPERIQ